MRFLRKDLVWLSLRIILLLFAQWLVETIFSMGLLDFLGSGEIQTLAYDVLQNLLLSLYIWFIFALYRRYIVPASTKFLSSAIDRFVRRPEAKERAYSSIIRYFTYAGYIVVAFALVGVWAYSYIGTWLAGTLGTTIVLILTFIFGLFTSSVLGNLLAYWVLHNTIEFKVGDRVQIDKTYGDIVELGFFFTRVKTIKDEIISLPNLVVMAKEVQNFSTLEAVLIHIPVTLTYDVDVDEAKQLLIKCAEEIEGIIVNDDKKPFVLFLELGKFTVTYEINAYTDKPNELIEIKSDLIEKILHQFKQAKIELLSPTFVTLRKEM